MHQNFLLRIMTVFSPCGAWFDAYICLVVHNIFRRFSREVPPHIHRLPRSTSFSPMQCPRSQSKMLEGRPLEHPALSRAKIRPVPVLRRTNQLFVFSNSSFSTSVFPPRFFQSEIRPVKCDALLRELDRSDDHLPPPLIPFLFVPDCL